MLRSYDCIDECKTEFEREIPCIYLSTFLVAYVTGHNMVALNLNKCIADEDEKKVVDPVHLSV